MTLEQNWLPPEWADGKIMLREYARLRAIEQAAREVYDLCHDDYLVKSERGQALEALREALKS